MKTQIRQNVFETNSSSVHSLTICSQEDYDKWEKGELLLDTSNDVFIELKDRDPKKSYEYQTYEEYTDRASNFEDDFHQTFVSKSGDTIVAFGYSGFDG